MVGFSPKFIELQSKLDKIARYQEPVLITGESGAGKEFFAQAVYLFGGARQAPFVPSTARSTRKATSPSASCSATPAAASPARSPTARAPSRRPTAA